MYTYIYIYTFISTGEPSSSWRNTDLYPDGNPYSSGDALRISSTLGCQVRLISRKTVNDQRLVTLARMMAAATSI